MAKVLLAIVFSCFFFVFLWYFFVCGKNRLFTSFYILRVWCALLMGSYLKIPHY
uniref:Uncharacterized protein n=1 Tax=Anguilla anguilla TaxID=7936 RepID=A0A0E9WT32_ANGAN